MGQVVCILSENPIASNQLAKRLTAMGVNVVSQTHVDVCLREHAKNPFQLILLDRLQSNSNSKIWMKRIRDECFDLPVLLLIAFSEAQHLDDYLRMGATDYVYKPVVDAALFMRLRHYLNGLTQKTKPSFARGSIKSAA